MTLYRYKAEVLTPTHIGTGETLDPSGYTVVGNRVVPFSPTEIVADLPVAEQSRFEQLVMASHPNWKAIQNYLTHRVESDTTRRSIAVSNLFLEEYKTKLGNPLNQLKLHPFQRNVHTGETTIPGSSLKGAIRTAVVSHFINMDNAKGDRIRNLAVVDKQAKELEPVALSYTFRELEKDPFRGIKIADVVLPGEATRVDRVIQWNPKKPGQAEGIALWYERLLAKFDGGEWAPTFEVWIQIEDRQFGDTRSRRHFGEILSRRDLAVACNEFYRLRMEAEKEKFFPNGHPAGEIYKTILREWPESPAFIIRVGRFCQFESLSVDGFRQGWNVQAKRLIAGMGSSRNLCRITTPKETIDLPFGWMLLMPLKPGEQVSSSTNIPVKALEPAVSTGRTSAPEPTLETWEGAYLVWDPGQKVLKATIPGKRPAECRGEAARRLLEKLPEDRRATLVKKGLGGARVSVRPVGNGYELVDLL